MKLRLARMLTRAEATCNAPVSALLSSPRWGRLIRRYFVIVTYTGRRSGRTISLPLAYRRRGDDIAIDVNLPGAKTWWRNFLGDGRPLTVKLDGRDRTGHAVARQGANGRVSVQVRLDQV